MTGVLLCTQRLSGNLLAEAKAACEALDLHAQEWPGGIPHRTAAVMISALLPRERRVPEELCALLEAAPGIRLVLCAQEPLVQPRVVLDDRVTLLSPPVVAEHLAAALAGIEPEPVSQRFEALRRHHWVAWSRGRCGPPIALFELDGATVVVGETEDPAALAELIHASPGDAQLEDRLDRASGGAALAHLTPDAREWLLYWPSPQPLWLCSRHRLPTRWDAAQALSASGRRLIRLPAFSDDQLVAAWGLHTEGPPPKDSPILASRGRASDRSSSGLDTPAGVLAPLERTVADGGSETMIGLAAITERRGELTGLVMEVR